PDVNTHTLLVRGLAASLRVSDALSIIGTVCRVGVSPGEEVPFGKIVRCPSCMIAVAVAKPQNVHRVLTLPYQVKIALVQIVSCSKCRYQYELVSGNIISIESEEIRFATKTVDLPAQEGERVTIASAAPSSVYCEGGPLKFSPKTPNNYPGE
ncbi:hypothetical protein Tco_0100243, partial [Tanacetum coccineum]